MDPDYTKVSSVNKGILHPDEVLSGLPGYSNETITFVNEYKSFLSKLTVRFRWDSESREVRITAHLNTTIEPFYIFDRNPLLDQVLFLDDPGIGSIIFIDFRSLSVETRQWLDGHNLDLWYDYLKHRLTADQWGGMRYEEITEVKAEEKCPLIRVFSHPEFERVRSMFKLDLDSRLVLKAYRHFIKCPIFSRT